MKTTAEVIGVTFLTPVPKQVTLIPAPELIGNLHEVGHSMSSDPELYI